MKILTSLTKLSAIVALAIILSTVNAVAATFTVINIKDSGAGSLRQAVLDANAAASADTIVFDVTFFGTARTITLATEIAVSPAGNVDSLTITGPGANLLTITVSGFNRIFTNGFTNGTTADTLSISGMTITRSGTLTQDAATIQNAANLTVTNVVFNSISGGAIDNTNNISRSHLTVTNSVFNSNTAFFGGAAIANNGVATITNSTFTSNTAGAGGAISSGDSLTVTGCTFTNNSATSTSATGLGGGAIYSSSDLTTEAANITNSTFTGNTEVGGSGGGGAVRNRSGSMTITNSIFTSNTGLAGGGAIGNGDILSISGSTFTGNSSSGPNAQRAGEGSGGAISNQLGGRLTIANSLITGNSAANHGGGIYYQPNGGTPLMTITNTTISNNTANSNNDTIGSGGGLYMTDSGQVSISISGSTFSGNKVIGGQTGGGIHAEKVFDMTNSTVSGNSAGAGGGIYITNTFGFENANMINFTNSTIAKNTATGQGGGVYYYNSFNNVTVNLRNSIFADNVAAMNPDLVSAFGAFNSNGFNLIENPTGATITGTTTGNITGVDPQLAPLADNGGPTQTHALLTGSPALDKGKSADIMSDQRSLLRPFDNPSIANASGGDGSDIGAFEDQPPNTAPGNDVTVEAPAGDSSVTFASVSKAGFTTFAAIVPPSSAGTPPTGYTIVDDAPAYDINTTATFTAPITVCFTVNAIADEAEFARVRILHGENGVLVDRTDRSSLAFASRTVCASVDSLSPFVIALAPAPGLLNISTRLQVRTGDQVLIGGFIVAGTDPKKVILRAIGPSLSQFGINDPLADPILELRAGDGSLIMSNDNWTSDRGAIQDTGLQPSSDLESAIVATLEPGNYTAIMSGKNGGTGVGLVEAYDLNQDAASELANISTRGFVETGNNVMIGGLILGNNSTVLVRAIGPTLSDFGVAGALADPTLELRDGQGTLVSSNDNWILSPQKTEIENTGLAPKKDVESAVLETLNPGAYTAIVAGQGGGTGVGLVEVYRLP